MMSSEERSRALLAFATALPILQRGWRVTADKSVVQYGLSQAMAWPLVMIGRLGNGVRPGVLAEALAIESPSLGRQLDQLVESGLIERRDDAVDRRAKTLHLTPAGQRARARIETSLDAVRRDLFDGVDDDDLAASLRVFDRLGARMERGGRLSSTSPSRS